MADQMAGRSTKKSQMGRMQWTADKTTQLLNLIAKNDGWRFNIFGEGHRTDCKYTATRQLCLAMFSSDKGWLISMQKAGLVVDDAGVWRASEAWMSSSQDTVSRRLEQLKKTLNDRAIKAKFKVNPARWKSWDDIPAEQRKIIKKAYPYYFIYRDLRTKKALYASLPEWKTVAAPAHAVSAQGQQKAKKRRREASMQSESEEEDGDAGDELDSENEEEGDDVDMEARPPAMEANEPRVGRDMVDVKPKIGSWSMPVEVVDSSPEVKTEPLDHEQRQREADTRSPSQGRSPARKRRRISSLHSGYDIDVFDPKPTPVESEDDNSSIRSTTDSSSVASEDDGESAFDFGDVNRRVHCSLRSRLAGEQDIYTARSLDSDTNHPRTRNAHADRKAKAAVMMLAPTSAPRLAAGTAPLLHTASRETSTLAPVEMSNAGILADLLERDDICEWIRLVIDQPVKRSSNPKDTLLRARKIRPSDIAMGPECRDAISKGALRNPDIAAKATNLRDYLTAYSILSRHKRYSWRWLPPMRAHISWCRMLCGYRIFVKDKEQPSRLQWVRDMITSLGSMGATICDSKMSLRETCSAIRVIIHTDSPVHPLHFVRSGEEMCFMASPIAMCRLLDQIHKVHTIMASLTAEQRAREQLRAARTSKFDRDLCPVLVRHEWLTLAFHPPHHNTKRTWARTRLRLLLEAHESLAGARSPDHLLKDVRVWFDRDKLDRGAETNYEECPDTLVRATKLFRSRGAQVVESLEHLVQPPGRKFTLIVDRLVGLNGRHLEKDQGIAKESLLKVLLRLDDACCTSSWDPRSSMQ